MRPGLLPALVLAAGCGLAQAAEPEAEGVPTAAQPASQTSSAAASPSFGSALDPWLAVKRLLGNWVGESTGQAGAGQLTRSYRLVMGGRYVQENSETRFPASEKHPLGQLHQHWAMFSLDKAQKAIVLRQFHIEGIVSTYLQAHPVAGAALVFESHQFENFNAQWKARERYEFVSPDEFVEIFELAAPGQPYQTYSRSHLKRQLR